MKYLAILFILTALVAFCICRKNLEAHLEDKDLTRSGQKKGLPFFTSSVNEERKFFTEESVDEEGEFSSAAIKKNFGEHGRGIYPTEIILTAPQARKVTTAPVKTKIPESLLIAMNDVRTADEFLRRFVAAEPEDVRFNSTDAEFIQSSVPSVLGRKGLSGGLAPLATAEFAGCRPQKTVVKVLDSSESYGVLLWPPCVYLNRCGGCCLSEQMTCRPTAVSSVNVTVLQARYTGPQSSPFANEGVRVISMEQHDKCTCECKQLPENCTPFQEYRKNECRCVCPNHIEAASCQQQQNKFWDIRDCTCKCRNPVECSSGLFFSIKTCRCEMLSFTAMSRIGRILPVINETALFHREPQPVRYGEVKSMQHN